MRPPEERHPAACDDTAHLKGREVDRGDGQRERGFVH